MEQLHMQYDTIMNLQFYIFENILQHYSDILEERKKAEKEEMKEQGFDEKNYNPTNVMKQAQKSMPKMPTITIPKFQ